MRAGRLRHRLAIQAPGPVTRSPTGAEVPSWPTIATVWASIQPTSAREVLEGVVMQADVTHLIGLRYRTGITPGHRLTQGSRVFEVKQVVDVDERHRELQLLCTEAIR